VVNMTELHSKPGQPADGPSTGREHTRPAAGDGPASQPGSNRGAGIQTPPDPEAGDAAQVGAVGPPLDHQRSDGAAPQDAPDTVGQQEAAAPDPEGLPVGAAPERLAPLPLRLLAFAVDLACVVAVLVAPILFGTLAGVRSLWLLGLVLTVGLITYLTVSVWLTGGQTIGKAMCSLTVRRIDGTAPARTWVGLAWSLGRHSAGYLLVDVFGLGVLAALAPPRRCLHDYAFASEVVIRPTDGDQRLGSPLARLRDFDERLKTVLEKTSKQYAWLVRLWNWLTKLVLYPAMAIIVVAGKNPESWLGRVWAWMQRRIVRLVAQARSPAGPAKPLSAQARAGLWAVTAPVAVVIGFVAVQVLSPPPAIQGKVSVSGTADIFAAGQSSVPNLSQPGTLPPGLTVTEGSVLRFDAAGTATCEVGGPLNGPDGGGCVGGDTDISSFGTISGIVDHQASMFLVGVFTGDRPPTGTPPPSLDFSAAAIGHNFSHLDPALNQVFFIGDGKRSDASADRQLFIAPRGATHLYLGFADAYAFQGTPGAYDDNSGLIGVTIREQ